MGKLRRAILLSSVAFVQVIGLLVSSSTALQLKLESKTIVRSGAHPWYEVKVDPENPQNVIICGTKLDPAADAVFGFIYASTDGGKTWHTAMEDRNSLWVSEQSCAFGPHHRAYFVSEASKVVRGTAQHEQGTTRLYVSADGGQNWAETAKTGWADYSTSVTGANSGELYTFFNTISGDPGLTWGSNVGVLVFSSDGKSMDGPFFDSTLQDLGYEGAFPSGAVWLNSGTAAALYYGLKTDGSDTAADLGILRLRPSHKPVLDHTPILHMLQGRDCLSMSTSLAHDPRSNRLFLAYVDGCKERHITLLSSDDEGRTWKDSAVLGSYKFAANPSLVVTSDGSLVLLWEEGEGSGQWLFSTIQNQKLVEPATELSPFVENAYVNNDSLFTWVAQANERHGGKLTEPSITLDILNMFDIVWRSAGAVSVGDKILVAWGSGDKDGTKLYSALLTPGKNLDPPRQDPSTARESDVTEETVILHGGLKHFDPASGNLDVCLMLGNRGTRTLRAPLRLEVTEVSSPIGAVTIMNATNSQAGVGAMWDISNALTGTELPPREVSNTFCLSFRVAISSVKTHALDPDDLLILKLRVLARISEERASAGGG